MAILRKKQSVICLWWLYWSTRTSSLWLFYLSITISKTLKKHTSVGFSLICIWKHLNYYFFPSCPWLYIKLPLGRTPTHKSQILWECEDRALLDLPTDKLSLPVEDMKDQAGNPQPPAQGFPGHQCFVGTTTRLSGVSITQRTKNLISYPPFPQTTLIQW